MNKSTAGAPSLRVVNEAITWWATLQSGVASDADRASCQEWLARDLAHREAWERLGQIAADTRRVPSPLAHAALAETHPTTRRAVLRSLLGVAGFSALGWVGFHHTPWQRLLADQSTGVGERRQVSLGNGLELTLNSNSAVRIRMTPTIRAIDLLRGELLVNQVANTGLVPLQVDTGYGLLQVEHARFDAHRSQNGARVGVYAGSVRLVRDGAQTMGEEGEGLRFKASGLVQRYATDPDRLAWTDGMIVAKNWRLEAFVRHLQHYRHGVIQVDPAVADLKLSGVFPIDDAERALNALTRTLPIRVQRHTQYWLQVGPRADGTHSAGPGSI